jgi:hypothetical protein
LRGGFLASVELASLKKGEAKGCYLFFEEFNLILLSFKEAQGSVEARKHLLAPLQNLSIVVQSLPLHRMQVFFSGIVKSS